MSPALQGRFLTTGPLGKSCWLERAVLFVESWPHAPLGVSVHCCWSTFIGWATLWGAPHEGVSGVTLGLSPSIPPLPSGHGCPGSITGPTTGMAASRHWRVGSGEIPEDSGQLQCRQLTLQRPLWDPATSPPSLSLCGPASHTQATPWRHVLIMLSPQGPRLQERTWDPLPQDELPSAPLRFSLLADGWNHLIPRPYDLHPLSRSPAPSSQEGLAPVWVALAACLEGEEEERSCSQAHRHGPSAPLL